MNNTRYELFSINMLLLFVPMLVGGVNLMAGFAPPPAPDMPIEQVSRIFSPENMTMRIGLAIALFGSCLLAFPMAAVAEQIRRMEASSGVLAKTFMVLVTIFCVCNFLPIVLLLAASYRPDILPDAKILLIDSAWFMFVGAIWSQVPINLIMGIAILGDKTGLDIYPKWMGYINFLFALAFLPAAIIPLVHIGPFTYSGTIGFFLSATVYSFWAWATYGFTVRAIRRQRAASA